VRPFKGRDGVCGWWLSRGRCPRLCYQHPFRAQRYASAPLGMKVTPLGAFFRRPLYYFFSSVGKRYCTTRIS
jgi:hypothetical protein